MTPATGRGSETRRRAQQIALDLFTRNGYESTSLRQIADELGINKASLYYYFDSKEAILRSLFDARLIEVTELLEWIRSQPRCPRLLNDAVLRWVDSFTVEKLSAIRFMTANPLVFRGLADADGDRIGPSLVQVGEELSALLPTRDPEAVLLVRMAFLSINAAVQAAARSDCDDATIIAAARRAARAMLHEIGGTR